MLARIALEPFEPAYELLDAPHSLRHQSQCGRQPDAPDTCGPHASGCGIAWLDGSGGIPIVKRGPEDRWDESFQALVRSLRTTAILAHNRLASPGLKIEVASSHPFAANFRGAPVAFCHNGGIKDLMDQAKNRGITDSLLFFEQLLAAISALTHEALAKELGHLATAWRYTSLTGLLLTPGTLHVWRCYDERHARRADFEKYYTLWARENQSDVCIASEKVDENAGWQLLPNRTLLSIARRDAGLNQARSRF